MILEYQMIREGKRPSRSNPSDAGLDVYWNPDPEDHRHGWPGHLQGGESAVFKTGLKIGVPHGYMIQVMNRSSMASRGLIVGAHVIDAGYGGEIMINLHNVKEYDLGIKPGDKIAQLVMIPVIHFRLREVGSPLYRVPICISNRGDGGFGSTGG